MQTVSPGFGLIFWSVLGLVSFILIVIALFLILKNERHDIKPKLLWIAIVILIPVFGATAFLVCRNRIKQPYGSF